MSYNMTSARERDLEGLLNDARCKIEELEEKIEDIQREIDDDLEYALLKFARENKEIEIDFFRSGNVYMAKYRGGEIVDTIDIYSNGHIYDKFSNKLTQAEMWKILGGWKNEQ